jgi:hypothetical protein
MPFTTLPNAMLRRVKDSSAIYADCRRPFHDADDVIDINIIEDPTYKVAAD